MGEKNFYDVIESKLAHNELFLFYYWQPSAFITKHQFTRVSLPGPTDVCYSNNTQDRSGRTGSVDCDFPSQDLIKLYSSALVFEDGVDGSGGGGGGAGGSGKAVSYSPYGDAVQLMRRMTLRGIDQTQMLAHMEDDPELWADSAWNLSCVWMHSNIRRVQSWIVNTPQPNSILASTWKGIGVAGCIVSGVGLLIGWTVLIGCHQRRNRNPLAFYFPPVLLVGTTAAAGSLQAAIVSIIEPRNYDAETFYWIFALCTPATYACVLATCLRFHFLSQFRDKRSVVLRREMVRLDLLKFGQEKLLHSTRYTLLYAAGFFVPALVIAFAMRFGVSKTYSPDPANAAATVDQRHRLCSLVISLVYVPAIAFAAWSIRLRRESFAFRERMFVYAITLILLKIIQLSVTAEFDTELTGNNGFYATLWLQYLGLILYLYLFVVIPVLATFEDCLVTHLLGGSHDQASGVAATPGNNQTTAATGTGISVGSGKPMANHRSVVTATGAHHTGLPTYLGMAGGSGSGAGGPAGRLQDNSLKLEASNADASVLNMGKDSARTATAAAGGGGANGGGRHERNPSHSVQTVNHSVAVQHNNNNGGGGGGGGGGGDDVDLLDILNNRLGFRYFYLHCIGEYSDENVLCWKAIQEFKEKTSLHAMIQLYKTFLSPAAPLQVNVPYAVMHAFELKYQPLSMCGAPPSPPRSPTGGGGAAGSGRTVNVPIEPVMEEVQSIFNPIQNEVLQLMKRDTLTRFINSPLFDRYDDPPRSSLFV